MTESRIAYSQSIYTRDMTCHPDGSNVMAERKRSQTGLGYKPTAHCVPWKIKYRNLNSLMYQCREVGSEPSWIVNISHVGMV